MNWRSAQALSRDMRVRVAGIALLVALAAFFFYAPTPSSYGKGRAMLGLPAQGLYLGEARAVRSDEWMVYTPYVQIAVARDLGTESGPPYHVPLRAFLSLPIRDWGLVFKPYYWGFLVLPPAQAYALTFLFHTLAFVIGWALLFQLLRIRPALAIPAALTLYWAQFTQVWWTTNAGSFSYAPWVAIAWISVARPVPRTLVLAYVLFVWIIASGYPPFLYAFGLALAVLVVANRPETLRPARLVSALAAILIAGFLSYQYFGDLYQVMANTVYPGERRVVGGGLAWQQLSAHLLPWLSTTGFEPAADVAHSNACEIGVLGSIVPLAALLYTDWRNTRLTRREGLGLALSVATMALVLAWALDLLPLPIAQLLLLDRVHPNRLLPALGLMLFFVALQRLSWGPLKLTLPRHLFLAAALLLPAAWKYHLGSAAMLSYFDFVAPALVLSLAMWQRISGQPQGTDRPQATAWAVLAVAALANLLTFGLFNPVQSARAIFQVDKALVERNLQARGAQYVHGVVVVPGDYGALIAGAGVTTFNGVLLQPRMHIFRAFFPRMPADQFNLAFNRYEHIAFGEIARPVIRSPDLLELPIALDRAGLQTSALVKQLSLSEVNGRVLAAYLILADDSRGWVSWQHRLPGRLAAQAVDGMTQVVETRSDALAGGFASTDLPDFPGSAQGDGEVSLQVLPLSRLVAAKASATVDVSETSGSLHDFTGWLPFDARKATTVTVYTDLPLSAFMMQRISRPDVAKIVSPDLYNSGFKVELQFAGPAGPFCLQASSAGLAPVAIAGSTVALCR